MRTIVQLSDLHFGAILEATLDPLVETLDRLAPDLTIISGDLTQRASTDQFRGAQRYMARLPQPQLVVPGNHDVPLYDVIRRFASPLGRYREHITTDLSPVFVDDEIAVVGVNSARSLTFKGGSISNAQLAEVSAQFDAAGPTRARIVVAHHPFDIPAGLSGVDIVGNRDRALETFDRCQVDLMLAGHLHLVHVTSAARFRAGYEGTILGAGTATSTRARGEFNSFFVFRVEATAIECERHTWDPDARTFARESTQRFLRVSGREQQ